MNPLFDIPHPAETIFYSAMNHSILFSGNYLKKSNVIVEFFVSASNTTILGSFPKALRAYPYAPLVCNLSPSL